jgi:VWFA-related protein
MTRLGLAFGSAIAAAVLVSLPSSYLSAAPQAQGQAPQATFRSATNLIEVDVVVHDGDGRFVTGLTADDLEIFEDGEPQEVQQFYLVAHEASGVAAQDPTRRDDLTLDPRGRRLFVFLFDLAHLSNESLLRIKAGTERFINAQFQPGDYGGIFAAGSMYNGRITTDKIELLAGLHSVRPAFDTRDRLLLDLRGFPTIPAENDAVRIDYGDQRLLDTLAEEACEDTPSECEILGGQDNVEFQLEQKAKAYLREARVLTANIIDQLRLVAGNLSSIPGRKTVIFLSDGFFIEENRSQVQQVAAIAARGGSAFYSVYGQGTSIVGGQLLPDAVTQRRGRNAVFDSVNDGPEILTSGTGGFIVRNANDINRALGLVARDTSTYYVLGYSPTNSVMDGKVRSIRVNAKADGLRVRARKGYVASPLPPMRTLGGRGGGQ